MDESRILINVPNLNIPGGVSSLYSTLDLESQKKANYFYLYFEKKDSNYSEKIKRLILKYFEFYKTIYKYDIILINPSLTFKSFFRDSIFAFLIKLRNRKLIVFWHGWEDNVEEKIKDSFLLSTLFKISFGKADGIIVLGRIFQNKILDLYSNKKGKFLLFQNVANFKYIKEKPFSQGRKINKDINILFMSRIEKNKGALESIKILEILQMELTNQNVYLTIAGAGSELENIKNYLKQSKIKNITLTGHVEGEIKHDLFTKNDFFLFPSSYGEGLPLVILEAMAYGLPIITSPIGGIPDLIQNGTNGYLIEPWKFTDYVKNISLMISDEKLYSSISNNNYNYSKQNLTPEIASEKLITFCEEFDK